MCSHNDRSEAVTEADVVNVEVPLATLARDGVDLRPELPIALQIDHHGVDGALVALGVHTHATDDLRAGLGTVVQQGGADSDAGEGVEHGSVVVNKRILQHGVGGCDPSRNIHSQSRMMLQNDPLPWVCSHHRSAASDMHAMGSSSKSSASTTHSTSSPPLGIQWRWSVGRKNDTNTSTVRGLVVCWMNWVMVGVPCTPTV